MDWVHCNNCFALPESGKGFCLTSCGHIYCADCRVTCTTEVCRLCKNQCSVITLSSQMKPDVQMYFTAPLDLLKSYIKDVQQVAEFQKNHRARLLAYQQQQVRKMKDVKEELRRIAKKAKECNSEKQKLKKENEELKKLVRHAQSRIPETSVKFKGLSFVSPQESRGTSQFINLSASTSGRGTASYKDFFSPTGSVSSVTSGPTRVIVRSPPVDGKIGSVTGITPTANMITHLKLSGSGGSGHSSGGVKINFITPSCRNIPRGSPMSSQRSSSSQGSLSGTYRTPPEGGFPDLGSDPVTRNSGGSGRKQVVFPSSTSGYMKAVVHPYSPAQ